MGLFDGITNAISGVIGDISGGDILKAGASMLGGSQANQKSWDIAMATNAASAQEAQKNRDWQENMRKTQYQTTVNDLMAAGLNPMLAYTQGGAGVPSGAQATMQQATVKDVISPAVQTMMQNKQVNADVILKTEQAKATTAQSEVARTQALQNIAQTAKTNQDEKTSAATEAVNREQLKAIAAEIAFKNQATRTSSAQAGLTAVQTRNETSLESKTPNPWWLNKLQSMGTELHNQWQNIRQKQGK